MMINTTAAASAAAAGAAVLPLSAAVDAVSAVAAGDFNGNTSD